MCAICSLTVILFSGKKIGGKPNIFGDHWLREETIKIFHRRVDDGFGQEVGKRRLN